MSNNTPAKGRGFYAIADDGLLHKASEVRQLACPMLCGKVVGLEVAVFVEPDQNDCWFTAYKHHHACPDCLAAGHFED